MSKIFITSDTFFGRKSVIKKTKRPFESVEEMDSELIKKWNNVVSKNDTVYHLGNFAWDPISAENALRKLNGHIIFILGEYDDALLDIAEYFEGISISEDQIIKEDGLKAVLSHWPLEQWLGKNKDIFHFHGASLKSLKTDLSKMKRVNVCCDNFNYVPQDVNDLYEMFDNFEKYKKENKTKK